MTNAAARREIIGRSLTWLCGGALAINLLLVGALLGLLAYNGSLYFWQPRLMQVELANGGSLLGELRDRELVRHASGTESAEDFRIQLNVGNRDLTTRDVLWLDETEIASSSRPLDAVRIERLEWGPLFGYLVAVTRGEEVLAQSKEEIEQVLPPLLEAAKDRRLELRRFEKNRIGAVNRTIEELRLELRALDLEAGNGAADDAGGVEQRAEIEIRIQSEEAHYEQLASELATRRGELEKEYLHVRTADGTELSVALGGIVRCAYPNRLAWSGRIALASSRLWEFLWDEPRESNTEGGVFPAIFGTVMMVFLMSIAVVPLGVLAALYLREYARQGRLVRLVRIAVNNLAGVPSIVFGVFGLGFFVYLVGGAIDRTFYSAALPAPTFGTGGILWASLTLALLTVPVVIIATEEGLASVPRVAREGSLALGATKLETILRVVLPGAAPGILTGVILAMARAAGEVAPLMIVGMVKLAPALPLDGQAPFVHLDRKFMHLGFHIYDLGFQSPNVEAVEPLVFATALLLIAIVTTMNLFAIALRRHLRRKFSSSAV